MVSCRQVVFVVVAASVALVLAQWACEQAGAASTSADALWLVAAPAIAVYRAIGSALATAMHAVYTRGFRWVYEHLLLGLAGAVMRVAEPVGRALLPAVDILVGWAMRAAELDFMAQAAALALLLRAEQKADDQARHVLAELLVRAYAPAVAGQHAMYRLLDARRDCG